MVTHCICFDVSFAEMKQLSDKHGANTIEELRALVPFGENCGLCRPYIERMLREGKTAFEWEES